MKALHTYNTSKANFTFCYYDKDHLGNVRQVTELDGSRGGNVIQRNNYYPFGAEFCDNTAKSSVQSRKYNGKEFDRMHGLNTYDYGARQYNPVTARWDRIDPLAEKYYSVSPYAYCMNNPVKFVDPDGRDIKFIEGTSKAFIEKYSMARQYLIENGCGQLIELFEKDKKLTLLIGERTNGTSSGFSPNRNCIFVDLDKGITSTDSNGNRHFLSPAVVLIHEFDHAWAFNYDKDGYDERTQKKDPLYGDMEEKRVIEGKETETARNLGEINEDEMSRDSHGAVPFTAVSPISNEPINKK